jgi:GNAT superfamily N-acetyltransferase
VITKSILSKDLVGSEHLWYVKKDCRGEGKQLLITAMKWSKSRGCSHFMSTASNFASSLHDSVCKVYERMGMEKLETVYMCKLED